MTNDDSEISLVSRALVSQLDLVWLFAETHVLPQIDRTVALWEPSTNTVTVRDEDGAADWPDEESAPLPEPTIAWLLWHIEWWWGNTQRICDGQEPVGPEAHQWSGSTTEIARLKDSWIRYLRKTDPNVIISGLMPEDTPIWSIAGWVNFELTKNLSEINQLLLRHNNG